MKTNRNKTSAKQKRVKMGKLGTARVLSVEDVKRVKGGADFSFVKRYDKSSPN